MTRKRVGSLLCLALVIWPTLVASQYTDPGQSLHDETPPDWPPPPQLDAALRFGAIATIGPLCGLRDPAWGDDLRRAELRAMGVLREAGRRPQQRRADVADAVLSYAEDNALETFAEGPPDHTCRPLAENPDLAWADQMVAAYRAGAGLPLW